MNDTTDAITTYLDDLGRMLTHLDPAERADVLGGVREHVDASLAELGHAPNDQEVATILASLGAPEDVARVASGTTGVPLPDGGATSRPSLTAAWVAPVVFGLAIAGIVGAPLLIPGVLWLAAAVLLGSSPLWTANEKVWGIVSGFAAGAAWLGITGMMLLPSTTCTSVSSLSAVEASGALAAEGEGGFHAPTTGDFTTTCEAAGANVGGIVVAVLLGAVILGGLVVQALLLRRGLARSAAGRTAGA
ncbi:hypothetical protein EQW78_10155 [Oerskovia turbata]|uniref:DUF1700 domain-containing protein n=1 Tax=Oerskovia turbata TaxID=1713 RepID=A0A4V1N503_9CELL|nr:hypothetical protein [Oerskovia turbata]RXR25393.1 hypothetical protein EQW73_11160 [Oerskovia turbata]RXR33966.1 hypothetical protein EQW78_10155 [Oerskovia turbata]